MEPTEKWECFTCTYKNFPSTIRCAICYNKKLDLGNLEQDKDKECRQGEIVDQLKVNSEDTPLPVNYIENGTEIESSLTETLPNKNRSRNPCSTSSSKKTTDVTTKLEKVTIDEHEKWKCVVCTFLNFPKSPKCSMCGEVKIEDRTITHSGTLVPLKTSKNSRIFNQTTVVSSPEKSNSDPDDETQETPPDAKRHSVDFNADYSPKVHAPKIHSQKIKSPTNNSQNHHNLSKSPEHTEFLQICREIIKGSNTSFLQTLILSSELLFKTITTSQQTELKLKPPIVASQPAQNNQLTIMHLAMFYRRKEFLKRLTKFLSSQVTTDFSPLPNTGNFVQMMRTHIYGQFRMVKAKFAQGYMESSLEVRHNLEYQSLAELRRQVVPAQGLWYLNERNRIFSLPASITSRKLYRGLVDTTVQLNLQESRVINFIPRLPQLIALRNRANGDCLLDSIMQCVYGVFDETNMLRKALYESMKLNTYSGKAFFNAHRQFEYEYALSLNYSINEVQIEQEYKSLLQAAEKRRSMLGSLHLFVLAHVIRRPIIVYSVRKLQGYQNDDLGFADVAGIYLPALFWEQNQVNRTPICIGYSKFHFSALVGSGGSSDEINSKISGNNRENSGQRCENNSGQNSGQSSNQNSGIYKLQTDMLLPLTDFENQLLSIPFIKTTFEENTNDNYYKAFLTEYMDLVETDAGIFCAVQNTGEALSLSTSVALIQDWMLKMQ